MAQRPSRRSQYDDHYGGYYAPLPYDNDLCYGPLPRRHDSERRQRRRSPDVAPRREHPHRGRPDPPVMSRPASGRRPRSPPVNYAPEPLYRESRRGDSRSRDGGHASYSPGPWEKPRHARHHHRDLEYRPRRDQAASPVDLYGVHHRQRRARPSSPEPRPRPRSYVPSIYGSDDEEPHRRRRARSHDGAKLKTRHAASPPRGRGRPTMGPQSSNPSLHARRGSVPAQPRPASSSSKPSKKQEWWQNPLVQAGARTALAAGAQVLMQNRRDTGPRTSSGPSSHARRRSAPAPYPASSSKPPKKQEWWQNPLVQAGARTALSAGAQAAMQNRHDPSPWFGSKGAKVATAALGAALMDGLGGGGKKQQQRKY